MPRGVPRLGAGVRPSSIEEHTEAPTADAVGTIRSTRIETHTPTSYGSGADLTELPPPWEVDPRWSKDNTDARQFVRVPETWELRWINPRLIDQVGWRDWQPVMASDPQVTVLVRQLVDVNNNIRRGGQTGDVLGWMPRHWVESRKRQKAERVARMTASAPRRIEELRERMRRGGFGPHVALESATHPTHTVGEGRTMKDD